MDRHRHHHRHSSSSSRRESRSEKRRRSRSRTRSRSRSPRYSYLSSSLNKNGKTRNELEIEVEVLMNQNMELRAQLQNLSSNLSSVNLAQVQASSTAAHWEAEFNRINVNYLHSSNALRTLKAEYDSLATERQKYIDEAEKYKKERDISEMTAQSLREQMTTISDRNTVLVKKCEELVKENKVFKEKHNKYEVELRELRPSLANLELELEKLEKERKELTEEVRLFKEKDVKWMAERKDMERRITVKDATIQKHKEKLNELTSGKYIDLDEERNKMYKIIFSLREHYDNEIELLHKEMDEIGGNIPNVAYDTEEIVDMIDDEHLSHNITAGTMISDNNEEILTENLITNDSRGEE